MNKKWSEKTILEKAMVIISVVALCVWVVFEILEHAGKVQCADIVNCISIGVICVCEAFLYWNVKRGLSYVAIAGVLLMIAVIVLQAVIA